MERRGMDSNLKKKGSGQFYMLASKDLETEMKILGRPYGRIHTQWKVYRSMEYRIGFSIFYRRGLGLRLLFDKD